jgi:hypothetical protein
VLKFAEGARVSCVGGVVKRALFAGRLGALSVSWVLDDRCVVGDDDLDWVTPVVWERGRLGVLRPSGAGAGGHASGGSCRPRDPDVCDEQALGPRVLKGGSVPAQAMA